MTTAARRRGPRRCHRRAAAPPTRPPSPPRHPAVTVTVCRQREPARLARQRRRQSRRSLHRAHRRPRRRRPLQTQCHQRRRADLSSVGQKLAASVDGAQCCGGVADRSKAGCSGRPPTLTSHLLRARASAASGGPLPRVWPAADGQRRRRADGAVAGLPAWAMPEATGHLRRPACCAYWARPPPCEAGARRVAS